MSRKLSPSQMAALRNMANGRPAGYGLYGRSARGGLSGTIISLHKRGLIDREGITDAGREALCPKETSK